MSGAVFFFLLLLFFFVTMLQVLDLHHASTFNIGERVRKRAILLQDRVLLAYLSAGDLISQEAVYHSNCLITLYNKALKVERKNSSKASHWHRSLPNRLRQYSTIQYNNFYFHTMVIKAFPPMGSCIYAN